MARYSTAATRCLAVASSACTAAAAAMAGLPAMLGPMFASWFAVGTSGQQPVGIKPPEKPEMGAMPFVIKVPMGEAHSFCFIWERCPG